MFQCDICGSQEAQQKLVTEMFEIDGRHVLVENIPVLVCQQCGEMTFDRETTERVRRMVHGEAHPARKVEVDLFAYT